MQQQAAINPSQPAMEQSAYPNYNSFPNHLFSYLSYSDPNNNNNNNNNNIPFSAPADATSAPTTYDAAAAAAAAYYAQPAIYPHADATSAAAYYQDPNALNWINSYASSVATNATQQSVVAQVHPTSWKNAANYKILKKKKNPVQHVWCDVCKIECNSKEILDSHKQGKKHKKNLEKLKASLAPAPVASLGVPNNSTIIGPQEKPKKRKAKEPEEDLETKKKKIVAGGTKVDLVRTCEICNVVCNSELVFKFHLAGQKHVAMMKKGKPLSWPLSG